MKRKALIADYKGNSLRLYVKFIGTRTKTNQYNESVQYQEIRATVNTSEEFTNESELEINGKPYRVTYFDGSKRPANITLSDNMLGI